MTKDFRRLAAATLLASVAALPAAADPWNGPYFGLSVGHAWSSSKDLDGPENTYLNCWWCTNDYGGDSHTTFAGGQAGYNFRFGKFMLGGEVDVADHLLQSSGSDPTHKYPGYQVNGGMYADIAARLGVIADKSLIYGKVGYGWMGVDLNWTDRTYSSYANEHTNWQGMVYGFGVEHPITDAISLKLEYDHLNFTNKSATMGVIGYPGNYQLTFQNRGTDTAELGVNFHFDSWK